MDWWAFYIDYGTSIKPFLRRNLQKVVNEFDSQVMLATNSIKVLNAKEVEDASTPRDISWDQLVHTSSLGDLERHESAPKSSEQIYSTILSAVSSPTGEESTGYAELKLRKEYNQLISWATKQMKFRVDGSQIYLMDAISLESTQGTTTLEISIPERRIAFEAPIISSKCHGGGYDVLFQVDTTPISSKPSLRYFMGDECIATESGYTCPFTKLEFETLEDLLQHHRDFHLNLFFGVHPTQSDAVVVEEFRLPTISNEDVRHFKSRIEFDSLLSPSIHLLEEGELENLTRL